MFLAWCRRIAARVQRCATPQRRADQARPRALGFEQLEDRNLATAGKFQFALDNFVVLENAGMARIAVTRTPGSTTFATVQFATSNGTAIAGVDYIARAGSPANQGMLSFAPGEVRKFFNVTIIDDHFVESDETIRLRLFAPLGGATLGPRSTALITIRDNDGNLPQRWVAQAHRNLIGGQITMNDLNTYTGLLQIGQSRIQVAQRMVDTALFRGAQVGRFYRQYLGRAPDPTGRQLHANILEAGGTLAQVKASILGSVEYFRTKGGATNGGFLAALFRDVLGRNIDQGARNTFGLMLKNGKTRAEVALTVLNSPEGLRYLVRGYYQAFLGRAPTATELTTGVTNLNNGAREESLMVTLVGFPEYLQKLQL